MVEAMEGKDAEIARLTAERDAALARGVLLGFEASAECYNGEYPFEGEDLAANTEWCAMRDRTLSRAKDMEAGNG